MVRGYASALKSETHLATEARIARQVRVGVPGIIHLLPPTQPIGGPRDQPVTS